LKQFDYNGKLIREITLPGIGTASNLAAKKKQRNCITLSPIISRLELLINLM
jgi:hypothetical protein